MRHPWLLNLILLLLAGACACQAQQGGQFSVRGLNSQGRPSEFDSQGGTNYFYNGVGSNQNSVVIFDKATQVEASDLITFEGDVTILDHGHIWRGTNFIYNSKTGEVRAGLFKTMMAPYSIL